MYRILEDIIMADGKIFGESESIQVKYYQSSDFIEDTEVVLPLEATYFENVVCLGKPFVYYPGLSNCSHCNRHVLTNAMTKSVGADSVFTVSEYQSFIYNYNESNPLEAAIP
jgi:hypothetical protein